LAAIPAPSQPAHSSASNAPAAYLAQQQEAPAKPATPEFKHDDPFAMVLAVSGDQSVANWVMDSGATCNATFDENDCSNIRECQVQVKAAGCSFTVQRMGVAKISALDEKGRTQQLSISDCLISPKFPCKLLSLGTFTKKGHVVTMRDDCIRISNKLNDVVLVAPRDSTSAVPASRSSCG
jgi:hypothetical protein